MKNSRSKNWPEKFYSENERKKKTGISEKILIRKIDLKNFSQKMDGKNSA